MVLVCLMVNENVNEEVNAPGTHCFSAASAASCCPVSEIVVIATVGRIFNVGPRKDPSTTSSSSSQRHCSSWWSRS